MSAANKPASRSVCIRSCCPGTLIASGCSCRCSACRLRPSTSIWAGAQREPAFLALNPLGQVPVIDDGGTVIADSNAILVYLAKRYGDAHWLPDDPAGAAVVQRWLSAGPIASGPPRGS